MNVPINAEFSELVIGAVGAVKAFVQAREHDLGYVPRREVPKFKTNDHGWPSVSSSFLRSGGADDPMNWSSLFGITLVRGAAKFTVADVPEFQAVVNYVAERPELAKRVSLSSTRAEDAERASFLLTADVISLVSTIIERSIATGESDRDVYIQHERALLADTLIADVLAPITLVMLDLEEPLEVADGVWIEPMDEATHRARAVDSLGSENPYLVSAATHAVVLRDRQIDNSKGSMWRRINLELQPNYQSEIEQVFQALTIVSEQPTGYAQVCIRPIDWADSWLGDLPAIESIATVRRYPTSLGEHGWNQEPIRISAEKLATLSAIFQSLTTTSKRGQLAARRLFGAALRTDVEDVILDACIGIEALLGEQKDELAHRMGLRAAVALAPHGWNPQRAHEVLKKVYGHRSKIVHGTELTHSTLNVGDTDYSTDDVAVFLLGRLLQSHLADSPPWTPEALDRRLFSSLESDPAGTEETGGATS